MIELAASSRGTSSGGLFCSCLDTPIKCCKIEINLCVSSCKPSMLVNCGCAEATVHFPRYVNGMKKFKAHKECDES